MAHTEMGEEVKHKHMDVFASLYKTGRGARKNVRWNDFVKAMTSVGFAYEPASAGGSERQFTRDTGNAIVSFTWDEPHDGILTKRAQDHLSKLLADKYGWSKDSFSG